MNRDISDFSILSFSEGEVYRDLLEIQHTLERDKSPSTDAVKAMLRRRAYELLSKYEKIPFKARDEMQKIRPIDIARIKRGIESL